MNLKEAYDTLGLNQSATDDDVKKKFRELSIKYHPDRNKEPDAKDKFNKINEAYQTVLNKDNIQQQQGGFNPFQDFMHGMHGAHGFNPFQDFAQARRRMEEANVILTENLTFKESVFGKNISVKYERNVPCSNCNGEGFIVLNNGCKKCNGSGFVIQNHGNMRIQTSCTCSRKTERCYACSGKGFIKAMQSGNITIPGGVQDGQSLRIGDGGHFIGNGFGDLFIKVNVEKNSKFVINERDIIMTLEITLKDAIIGCSKKVETLDGDMDIIIPEMSKHKDIIEIKNLGVNRQGSQKVILDISYPDDIRDLINK